MAIGGVFLLLQVLRLRNWYLFRIVTVIELSEGVLHWRTPRRSGEVSLTQITAVRPLQRTVPRTRFPASDSALVQIDVANADPIILWERPDSLSSWECSGTYFPIFRSSWLGAPHGESTSEAGRALNPSGLSSQPDRRFISTPSPFIDIRRMDHLTGWRVRWCLLNLIDRRIRLLFRLNPLSTSRTTDAAKSSARYHGPPEKEYKERIARNASQCHVDQQCPSDSTEASAHVGITYAELVPAFEISAPFSSQLDWGLFQTGFVHLYWKPEVLDATLDWFESKAMKSPLWTQLGGAPMATSRRHRCGP